MKQLVDMYGIEIDHQMEVGGFDEGGFEEDELAVSNKTDQAGQMSNQTNLTGKVSEVFLSNTPPSKFATVAKFYPIIPSVESDGNSNIPAAESILTILQPLGKKKAQYKSKKIPPAAAESILTIPQHADYPARMLTLYNKELASGVDGVTSKCNFHGLIGLACSHYAIHATIAPIVKQHVRSVRDNKILAAYGYMILLGKV